MVCIAKKIAPPAEGTMKKKHLYKKQSNLKKVISISKEFRTFFHVPSWLA